MGGVLGNTVLSRKAGMMLGCAGFAAWIPKRASSNPFPAKELPEVKKTLGVQVVCLAPCFSNPFLISTG